MQKKTCALKILLLVLLLAVFFSILLLIAKFNHLYGQKIPSAVVVQQEIISLPEPRLSSDVSIEEAMYNRRSIRDFTDEHLSLEELSQLIFASQGITDGSHRTVPSAGALYPIEIYVLVDNVQNISPGFYHYVPDTHSLQYVSSSSIKAEMPAIAYHQSWMEDSAADIVIAADYSRTEKKYGRMAEKYVHMEVGHAAQNVYLQAYALGLGTTIVAGFENAKMKKLMGIEYMPLAIMPVGK